MCVYLGEPGTGFSGERAPGGHQGRERSAANASRRSARDAKAAIVYAVFSRSAAPDRLPCDRATAGWIKGGEDERPAIVAHLASARDAKAAIACAVFSRSAARSHQARPPASRRGPQPSPTADAA